MDILYWISTHDDKIDVFLYRIDNDVMIKMSAREMGIGIDKIVSKTEMKSAKYSAIEILDSMLDELSAYSMRI